MVFGDRLKRRASPFKIEGGNDMKIVRNKAKEIIMIILLRFFCAHVHLREDDEEDLLMTDVVHFSDPYEYVTAMGNTKNPISTGPEAIAYKKKKIEKHKPGFKAIPTIMLTNSTTVETIRKAHRLGIKVVKYMPAGTTTNTEKGYIPLYDLIRTKGDVLREMQKRKMILSTHMELVRFPGATEDIHYLYREEEAIPYLEALIKVFPKLKIIVEHASTKKMIEFVKAAPAHVFATLTLQHALFHKGYVFDKNLKVKDPLYLCLPCLKEIEDTLAVREAMVSGNPKFFFGTDDAPHRLYKKMGPKPPSGISTPGIVAIALLCKIFEEANALKRLENFAARFGAKAYGLSLKGWKKMKVAKEPWTVAESYNDIVPLMSGETLDWQLVGEVFDLTH